MTASHTPNPITRRTRIGIIVLLWLLSALYWLVAIRTIHFGLDTLDFQTYYTGALQIRTGHDPFINPTISTTHDPPGFLLALAPLTWLSRSHALILWELINAASLLAVLALLAEITPYKWRFAPVVLLYPPVLSNFSLGQSKLEILVLLLLMMRWLRRKYNASSAAALAAASLLRIFPVFFLGYLAVRRNYQALAWTIVWLLAGTALIVACAGWTTCIDFLRAMHDFGNKKVLSNENDFALSAVILRNTGLNLLALATIPAVLTITLYASARADEDQAWRLFSLWIAAAIVLLPVLWPYDLVFLLIPMASLTAGRWTLTAVWLMALSYLIAGAQTWLFLFGKALLGLRLTSFLYPHAVHTQWLAALIAYGAAYIAAGAASNREIVTDKSRSLAVETCRTGAYE